MKRMIKSNSEVNRIANIIEKLSAEVGVQDIISFMMKWFSLDEDSVIECLEDLADRLVVDLSEED